MTCSNCERPMPPGRSCHGRCSTCRNWMRRHHGRGERPLVRVPRTGPGACVQCGAARLWRCRGLCRACYNHRNGEPQRPMGRPPIPASVIDGITCPDCRAALVVGQRVKGRCRPCYARLVRRQKVAPPGSDGARLRALRRAYGWSLRQVAAATAYAATAIWDMECGRCRVAPAIVAWLDAIPLPPRKATYSPHPSGLRQYIARHGCRLVEIADFCGCSETAVGRWVSGKAPLPPAVRAWLRAGAPADWAWGIPGHEEESYRADGRRRSGPTAKLRALPAVPQPARLARRWA